jgi:hypothetical protein
MKRIAVLLVLVSSVLIAASFAFADDGGGNGDKADKKKCQNVSLKGTAPATTFTITVDKANKAGRDLKSATLTFSGKVNINAVMCSDGSGTAAASASSLKLRNLKVGKAGSEGSGD